jgi:exonuclease VII small subunit
LTEQLHTKEWYAHLAVRFHEGIERCETHLATAKAKIGKLRKTNRSLKDKEGTKS